MASLYHKHIVAKKAWRKKENENIDEKAAKHQQWRNQQSEKQRGGENGGEKAQKKAMAKKNERKHQAAASGNHQCISNESCGIMAKGNNEKSNVAK